MRKIKFLVITAMILSIFLLSVICVSAEILPVKNAWIFNDNCVIVLRENGDLLFGDSIETQTPKLLAQDIVDFKGNSSPMGHFGGYALHKNGDIKVYSSKSIYENKQIEIETETINATAKEIFYTDSIFAYIDKNQKMKIISRYGDLTVDNSKKLYPNSSYDEIYIISTKDTLHKISLGAKDPILNKDNEIMSNVKDCRLANGRDILILRSNDDLYVIDDEGTPNRIGTNIESFDKVTFYDTWTDNYPIDYVNKNGEYFSGTEKKAPTKYMDNVKNVYIIGDSRYVLTNDSVLYSLGSCHWKIDLDRRSLTKYNNVQDIFITDDTLEFKLGTNGSLYRDDMIFYMKDVIAAFKCDHLGAEEDKYLFLKKNGELWGAFGKKGLFDAPGEAFHTAFSQKQTVLKINKKEIELTAKIQMVNDRTMYPFRECLENMGATVLWDSVNQIAIGEYNGKTIEFPIGKSEYYINGTRYEMDTTSYIDESIGRTYIPIRYAAEGLGFTVDWIDGALENIIDIYK